MKTHTNNLSQYSILLVILITTLFGLGGNAQIPYKQSPLIQTEIDTSTSSFVPKLYGIVYETKLGFVVTRIESNPYRFNQTMLVKESIGPDNPKYDSMLVAFYERKAFRDSVQSVQDSIREIVFSSRAWLEGLRINDSTVIRFYEVGFREYVEHTYGINLHGNRSPLELINLGGSDFDISWYGPHTISQKDAIKLGITHAIEDFSVSNASNPCKIDIVASFSLGSVLSITTTDWILTTTAEGTTWVAAFNVENWSGGSNSNGTDADITIEWNRLLSWDLSTTGGPAGTDPNLMYVFMHEFLHGMGFQSSAAYDGFEYTLGWSGFPNQFDRRLRDGNGAVVWGNPNYSSSTELGALFTSDDVWFELDTPAGYMVKLYAPLTWSGQAISHIDQSTYEYGTKQLLVPNYNPNTIYLDIGWIEKRVLETNGWTLNTMTLPTADFSVDDQTPTVGQTINFTDLSSGTPVEWYWEFGDGNTSGDQNPSYSYSSSGTYTVTLTATNWDGEDEEVKVDYIVVSAIPAPTITLQPQPTEGCEGDSLALQISATGTPPLTYQWYKNNTAVAGETDTIIVFNPSALNDAGDYFCRVTNSGGNTDSDTVAVTVNFIPATPTISASGDTTFCNGGSVDLSVDTPESGVTYTWSNGETGNSITVTQTGSYSCYGVNDNGGCVGASSNVISVTVNFIPTTPTISASGDTTFCQGGSVDLSVDTPETGVTYTWSNGETGNSITVTQTGSYSCYGVNDNGGCVGASSNVISVTIWENPIANAGENLSTPYNTAVQLNGSATNGTPPYSYWWEPQDQVVDPTDPVTMTIPLTTTTIFTLTVTDNNGCTDEDDMTVTVTGGPLSVTATVDPEEICLGDFSQLYALPSGGSGNYTYSWTSIPEGFTSTLQNPVVYPEETTTYIVEVFDGTDTATDDVLVTVHPLPEIILGDWPDTLCANHPPVQLTAEPEGGTYTGTGVSPDGLFDPGEAILGWNLITYTFENQWGCSSSDTDSIFVDVCPGIHSIFPENNIKIYPNPFKEKLTISFSLSKSEKIVLSIFDIQGRLVGTLVNQNLPVGDHVFSFKSDNLKSGVYIISLYKSGTYYRKKISNIK